MTCSTVANRVIALAAFSAAVAVDLQEKPYQHSEYRLG